MEIKTDDKIINHVRNVKLLQAIHSGKKFFVECYPTEEGAKSFPNTNYSVKEIELPNFDLYEEKLGYRWVRYEPNMQVLKDKLEFYFRNYYTNLLGNSKKSNEMWEDFKIINGLNG